MAALERAGHAAARGVLTSTRRLSTSTASFAAEPVGVQACIGQGRGRCRWSGRATDDPVLIHRQTFFSWSSSQPSARRVRRSWARRGATGDVPAQALELGAVAAVDLL